MVKQMNVAERITQLRQAKNITVNKLANQSGLSQGFVRQIELGKQKPTIDSLSMICEALGISLSEFFQETTPPSRPELLNKLNKNLDGLTDSDLTALIKVAECMSQKSSPAMPPRE
jgi:Predicted transcriptional regulators